jgi:hypothetical protein
MLTVRAPRQTATPAGRWSGGRSRWRYAVRAALPGPTRTPFTFWYLVLLLITTIVLHSVDACTEHDLLAWSSTNVDQLRHAPIRVMLASALWLPGLRWVPSAVTFSLVPAPVERRLGSRWTVAVFASGHVLATLVTELPIAWLVQVGDLPDSWADILDVGVSYGFFCTLGVLAGLLAGRLRWLGLAAAEAFVIGALMLDTELSSIGHVVALNLGVTLWWPWLAGRGMYGALGPQARRDPSHTPDGRLSASPRVGMDRNLS